MIRDEIAAYVPYNEQERRDRELILDFLDRSPDAFLRSSRLAHMTASAWVVNPTPTARPTCSRWRCGRCGRRRAYGICAP